MVIFKAAKDIQIKAILASYRAGSDGLKEKLTCGIIFDNNPSYSDIFSVTPEDVLEHVRLFGWDERIVVKIDALPVDPEDISWNVGFFILPPYGNKFQCGRRVSTERRSSPYELWSFESESAMQQHIVRELVNQQESFWRRLPIPKELL